MSVSLIIVGMKHSGKSTIGSLLAERCSVPFFDTDTLIQELSGKTARELFDQGGHKLMQLEETRACSYLRTKEGPKVVATGGGLADNPEAIRTLGLTGMFVYIDTPFTILYERVMRSASRDGRLPRFLEGGDPERLFRELFDRRTAVYATIADIIIDAADKSPAAIGDEILSLRDRFPHPARFQASGDQAAPV